MSPTSFRVSAGSCGECPHDPATGYFWAAFDHRCSRTCSTSGTLYAAGCAYGSSLVGQPCRSLVLYWNQSPAPVAGITGTSLIMYDEICLMSDTWVASSAVAYWSNSASTALLL